MYVHNAEIFNGFIGYSAIKIRKRPITSKWQNSDTSFGPLVGCAPNGDTSVGPLAGCAPNGDTSVGPLVEAHQMETPRLEFS